MLSYYVSTFLVPCDVCYEFTSGIFVQLVFCVVFNIKTKELVSKMWNG